MVLPRFQCLSWIARNLRRNRSSNMRQIPGHLSEHHVHSNGDNGLPCGVPLVPLLHHAIAVNDAAVK